jgi:hypothetical protein
MNFAVFKRKSLILVLATADPYTVRTFCRSEILGWMGHCIKSNSVILLIMTAPAYFSRKNVSIHASREGHLGMEVAWERLEGQHVLRPNSVLSDRAQRLMSLSWNSQQSRKRQVKWQADMEIRLCKHRLPLPQRY